MRQLKFSYYALFRPRRFQTPATVAAEEHTTGPTRAVVWNPGKKEWVFNPDVDRTISDDLNPERSRLIDRTEAEHVSREVLGTTLPSEEELHRICEEGEIALRGRSTF